MAVKYIQKAFENKIYCRNSLSNAHILNVDGPVRYLLYFYFDIQRNHKRKERKGLFMETIVLTAIMGGWLASLFVIGSFVEKVEHNIRKKREKLAEGTKGA